MLIRMTPNELMTMILQRANEIEADWKRHAATSRELTGPPFLRMVEGMSPEEAKAEVEANEQFNRSHREANLASMGDSLSRQIQWMRKMAEVFHAQTAPIECSLDDLIKLNLWPAAPLGGRLVHSVL